MDKTVYGVRVYYAEADPTVEDFVLSFHDKFPHYNEAPEVMLYVCHFKATEEK